jgi:acyl-CoA thioesterase
MSIPTVPSLDVDARVTPLAEGRFSWSVPNGWNEGRSTWSGVVVAALARAIEATEPEKTRRLRNMTTELLAAVQPGPTEIAVRSLRRGGSQSTLQADLLREGKVLVTATAMLASARREVVKHPVDSPEAPSTDEVPPLPVAPGWPELMHRFEFRPVTGSPFASAKEAVVRGWLRLVDPPAHADAALLLALVDAWWPAAWAVVQAPYMTATTTASSALACDPSMVDLSAPLLFSGRTLFDHEGFQMEARELSDRTGRLLATNLRTFVVLS